MQIQFNFNECVSSPTEVNGTYNINCDENNDVTAIFCTFFPDFSYVNLGKKKNITQKQRKAEYSFFGYFNTICRVIFILVLENKKNLRKVSCILFTGLSVTK